MLDDDDDAADVISLSNIGSRTFPMIIAYLETHAADMDFLKKLMIDVHYLKTEGLKGILAPKLADLLKIRSEKSKYKWLRDHIQSRGWKEESVRDLMKMNWAFVDLQQRCRKRLKELELDLEDMEEQAKKINMRGDL
ncbi:hypothetical protein CASFOL_000338 [Castilleja foliolosa]|uniref:Uncharacterized protein n=1 Tax=Castilleja foliolosa TaxID=1961234 RepID=A0ABD3EQJ9_9LAMI